MRIAFNFSARWAPAGPTPHDHTLRASIPAACVHSAGGDNDGRHPHSHSALLARSTAPPEGGASSWSCDGFGHGRHVPSRRGLQKSPSGSRALFGPVSTSDRCTLQHQLVLFVGGVVRRAFFLSSLENCDEIVAKWSSRFLPDVLNAACGCLLNASAASSKRLSR